MATTHIKSFDLIGKVEEVSDFISMISPADTPFQSSIGTDKIENTLYQWMEDSLRAVAKNAKLEGADGVDTSRDQPTMRSNGTQILSDVFKVSGTSEAVKTWGRDKIAAREMMKTGKVLKMDLEYSLVGNGQTYVVADGATPGEFASVQAQIHADTTTAVGGAITETAIVGVHEKLYNEGSDATVLMVKPSDTKVISAFAALSNRTRELGAGGKGIVNVINVYESSFGTLRVVKNRRIQSSNAIVYDPKNWKLAVLRNWQRTNLAKTGDSDRYMMLGEFGLKHSNRKASGLLSTLS